MAGSIRTFLTDRQTDRLTDWPEYIGPAGPQKEKICGSFYCYRLIFYFYLVKVERCRFKYVISNETKIKIHNVKKSIQ